jgi:hypothetical protein
MDPSGRERTKAGDNSGRVAAQFQFPLWLAFSISCAPAYLITSDGGPPLRRRRTGYVRPASSPGIAPVLAISYNRATNTCNLVCHGQAHGAASLVGYGSPARAGKVHR